DEVIGRRKLRLSRVQDGEVLGVSIGVADQVVERDPPDQLRLVSQVVGRVSPQQFQVLAEARATVLLVLEAAGYPESLAEVLLVESADLPALDPVAVVAIDEKGS